jgi:hypothetical protein
MLNGTFFARRQEKTFISPSLTPGKNYALTPPPPPPHGNYSSVSSSLLPTAVFYSSYTAAGALRSGLFISALSFMCPSASPAFSRPRGAEGFFRPPGGCFFIPGRAGSGIEEGREKNRGGGTVVTAPGFNG